MATLADINATLQMQTEAIGRQADATTKSNEILDVVRQRISDMLAIEQNNQKERRRSDERDRKTAIENKREQSKTTIPKGFMSGVAQGTGFSWISDFVGGLFGRGGPLLGMLTGALGLAAGKLIKWGAIGGIIATYFGDEITTVFDKIEEWTGFDLEKAISENPLLGAAATIIGGSLVDTIFSNVMSWSLTGLTKLTGLIGPRVSGILTAAFPRMIPAILGPIVSLLTGPVGLAVLAGAAIVGGAVLLGNYLEEKRGDFIKEIDAAVANGIDEIKNEGEVGTLRSLGVQMGFVTPENTSESLVGLESTLSNYKGVVAGGKGPPTPEMRAKASVVDWASLERSLGADTVKLIRGQLAAIKKSIDTPGFLLSISEDQLNQLRSLSALVGDKSSVQLIDKALDLQSQAYESIDVGTPTYDALGNFTGYETPIASAPPVTTPKPVPSTSPPVTTPKPVPSTSGSALATANMGARAAYVVNNSPTINNITNNNGGGGGSSIYMVPVGTKDTNDRRYGVQ